MDPAAAGISQTQRNLAEAPAVKTVAESGPGSTLNNRLLKEWERRQAARSTQEEEFRSDFLAARPNLQRFGFDSFES